jgi:hypothetical protein
MEQSNRVITRDITSIISALHTLCTMNDSFKKIVDRDFNLRLKLPLLGVMFLVVDWYANGGEINRRFINENSVSLFCDYVMIDFFVSLFF